MYTLYTSIPQFFLNIAKIHTTQSIVTLLKGAVQFPKANTYVAKPVVVASCL